MRDMSDFMKESYRTKCQKVNVVVYDMVKVSKELSEQLVKTPEYEGMEFELRDKKLARVVGQDMITDVECCFYDKIDKGVSLDVYRKGKEIIKDDGSKVTTFSMFPTCTVTLTPDDLKEFILEETTLDLFMGDRFIYNKRIVGNIDFMISNFK